MIVMVETVFFLSAECSGFYVGGVYFDDAVNESDMNKIVILDG